MIKTRPTRRKEEDSLRPLTEREIQQKLYGSYNQGQSALNEEDEDLGDLARRVEKASLTSKKRKISVSLPKVSFKLPWRDLLNDAFKGFRKVFSFFRIFVVKLSTGWGVGLLVVACLLLGIHALNAYRATTMKNPKPRMRAESSRRATSKPTQPAKKMPATFVAPEPVLKPVEEPAGPAAFPPVAKPLPLVAEDKPYVIQVCTYTKEEDAQKLVERMKTSGLPAFEEPLRRANGKTFYPVFLGRFKTFREAQAGLEKFREKPMADEFSDSFVRSL